MNADSRIVTDLSDQTVHLRILATSDLHMHLTSFDYIRARPNAGGSLARLATLIETARKDAERKKEICLLVDNGDTWQGTALADHLAESSETKSNPMSDAIKLLQYDVMGVGNHDFDFGIDFLSSCLSQTNTPVVCSNMQGLSLPEVTNSIILERPINTTTGGADLLKIGVLSTVPDLTNIWNRHHLAGKIWFSRPLPALRSRAHELRAKGADVVIVLAHMGFGMVDEGLHSQNELDAVAAIPEVDAVIGGHTHQRFPERTPVAMQGLIHRTPVVQPGANGSDLGQIKLTLARETQSAPWAINTASSKLIPAQATTPEAEAIVRLTRNADEKTRRFLDEPAARIAKPMNTYFALADPSPVQGLLAAAKRAAIAKSVAGTDLEALPLLATASAPLTGGLDGPENFISLQAGQLKHRHLAGMNPYANQVWAVRSSGKRLLDWLERSAVIFNTLTKEAPDQHLINPDVPGFRFDAIFGLSYQIDPTREPQFDETGKRRPNGKGRITNVTWMGRPLDLNQEFLVATTDHRAGGGGIYQPFANEDILLRGHAPLKTALLEYLANPSCDEVRSAKPWRFKPDLGVSAVLFSAPDASDCFEDIAHFAPENCGRTDDGFLRVRLSL